MVVVIEVSVTGSIETKDVVSVSECMTDVVGGVVVVDSCETVVSVVLDATESVFWVTVVSEGE